MCGDFGLSSELFRCKVCQFRSQHRYCSNQYPKAEDYSVCNWCLISGIKDDESGDKTQQKNSINSSSSNRTNTSSVDEEEEVKEDGKTVTKKKNSYMMMKKSKGTTTTVKLRDVKSTIKKQIRSPRPERLPVLAAARKRITTTTRSDDHAEEEKLRRTKSEEISNGRTNAGRLIKKTVFRNKVRRYKLLDEVSSL